MDVSFESNIPEYRRHVIIRMVHKHRLISFDAISLEL
jgi:hypothetical protein